MPFTVKFQELLDDGALQEFNQLNKRLRDFLLKEHNEDGTHQPAPRTSIVGEGKIFFGHSAPVGWFVCDGAAVSRATYRELWLLIGTTYGAGDGSTTFNLPDLGSRFPRGKSVSTSLGSTGGSSSHTHTIANHTGHTHTLSALETAATATTAGIEADVNYDGATEEFTVGGHAHFTTTNTETSDSGGAHDHGGVSGSTSTLPPYQIVNYIIFHGVGV